MSKFLLITYCCKEKAIIAPNLKVVPSKLYISRRIRKFISFCDESYYSWAIFSDLYGLVFKNDQISWYDKSPNAVSNNEYQILLRLTLEKIKDYDYIFFYYDEKTFHPLYRCLVNDIKENKKLFLINSLEIKYVKDL